LLLWRERLYTPPFHPLSQTLSDYVVLGRLPPPPFFPSTPQPEFSGLTVDLDRFFSSTPPLKDHPVVTVETSLFFFSRVQRPFFFPSQWERSLLFSHILSLWDGNHQAPFLFSRTPTPTPKVPAAGIPPFFRTAPSTKTTTVLPFLRHFPLRETTLFPYSLPPTTLTRSADPFPPCFFARPLPERRQIVPFTFASQQCRPTASRLSFFNAGDDQPLLCLSELIRGVSLFLFGRKLPRRPTFSPFPLKRSTATITSIISPSLLFGLLLNLPPFFLFSVFTRQQPRCVSPSRNGRLTPCFLHPSFFTRSHPRHGRQTSPPLSYQS